MRRKISYVVLLAEVFAITILHIAKYKKEQPVELVKSSYLRVETPKNTSSQGMVVNMKY
jgi:hypothetical protein